MFVNNGQEEWMISQFFEDFFVTLLVYIYWTKPIRRSFRERCMGGGEKASPMARVRELFDFLTFPCRKH